MTVYQLFFQILKQILRGNGKKTVFAMSEIEYRSFSLEEIEKPVCACNYVNLKIR